MVGRIASLPCGRLAGNGKSVAACSGRRRSRGFSLIEIVAVLVLIGIVAVVALNKSDNSGIQAFAEADALRAALRYAQARAMADVYTWGISLSGSSYQLVEDNPSVANVVLPGQTSATRTLPAGVSLSGDTLILFDWRGRPVTAHISSVGGASVAAAANQTITVTESATAQTVSITAYTGLIP